MLSPCFTFGSCVLPVIPPAKPLPQITPLLLQFLPRLIPHWMRLKEMGNLCRREWPGTFSFPKATVEHSSCLRLTGLILPMTWPLPEGQTQPCLPLLAPAAFGKPTGTDGHTWRVKGSASEQHHSQNLALPSPLCNSSGNKAFPHSGDEGNQPWCLSIPFIPILRARQHLPGRNLHPPPSHGATAPELVKFS